LLAHCSSSSLGHGLFDADEPAYAGRRGRCSSAGLGDAVFQRSAAIRQAHPLLLLILLSYRLFGITEFAVRVWSALAGVGLVALLCARRGGGSEARPPVDRVAFSANFLTALLARAAVTDMLFTFL